MNQPQVQVDRADDADRFLATDQTVWFAELPAAPAEDQLVGLPPDRRFAAQVDGADPATYPGVYGAFPMSLVVPGPEQGLHRLPCAGLTWVGVHPDHRRQGILTAMLRHHFEQTNAEGVAVSALHASEPAIYGRYGYGLASLEHEVTLGRGTALTAPHLEEAAAEVTTRLTTVTDSGIAERMHACHLRTAELGAVLGDLAYYERLCAEFPEHLRDKESWRVLFARHGGVDIGFAMFRRTQRWERARPGGELSVWAMVGEPAARLALLRRLLDYDLIATVQVRTVGLEDPLLAWRDGPRGTQDVETFDSLWVRLVDLPAALEQRAWSASCDVVVDVEDVAAPWNAGTWRIRAARDGGASVERSGAEAEVRVRTEALGSAYLGGGNLVALQRAGRVAESRRGAVAELWRAMRTDVAPGAAFMF